MIKRSLSAHERWRVPLVLLCLASRTASYTLQRDDDADGLLPDDVGLLTSNASGRPSWAEHILNLAQPSAHADATPRGDGRLARRPCERGDTSAVCRRSHVLLAAGMDAMRNNLRLHSALAVDDRVRYYLGEWYDKKVLLHRSEFPAQAQMDQPFFFNRSSSASADGKACEGLSNSDERYRFLRGTCTNYENDLAEHAREAGIDFLDSLVMFGDTSSGGTDSSRSSAGDTINGEGLPLLVKSRIISPRPQGIVFKLNTKRHWQWLLQPKPQEPAWEDKLDALVWRGSTTGLTDEPNVRHTYVKALFKEHDVGFSQAVQGRAAWAAPPPDGHGRNRLGIEEQLQYRYLLSREGNDVATDLKWKLASSSLVLMPKPTKEGWLMEGKLEPWVHYVPVDSPDDVEGKMQWCREHQAEVKDIIGNSTAFMWQFVVPESERDIVSTILWRYRANVKWDASGNSSGHGGGHGESKGDESKGGDRRAEQAQTAAAAMSR